MLAMTLGLGFAAPAHAETDPTEVNTAAITKILKVPVGTDYPNMGFTFSVAPVSYNDSTANLAIMPPIGNAGVVTISFNGSAETLEATVDGVSSYYLESTELFGAINWPNAGKYEYTIKETGSTYVISAGSTQEAMTLSQAEYRVTVYVREYTDADAQAGKIPAGKTVGSRYIYAIGMVEVKKDDGSPGSGTKGDPSPGGGDSSALYSGMAFTNLYVKSGGGGGPDPDPDPNNAALVVSKSVSGDLGSKVWPFDFSMTITVPTLIPAFVKSHYAAYLMEGATVLDPTGTASSTLIGTDLQGRKYLMFSSTTATGFKLTHGQSLVFMDAPVGTTYVVSESGESGYITTARVTSNGFQGAVATGAAGAGLSIPDGSVYTSAQLIGEATNLAAFNNAYEDATPAGIFMSNLPYVGFILLALGCLAVFIVVKRKKRQVEN